MFSCFCRKSVWTEYFGCTGGLFSWPRYYDLYYVQCRYNSIILTNKNNVWYISNHFNIKVNKIMDLIDVFCAFHLLYESNSLSNYGPFRCQVSPSGLRHIPGWRCRGVPSGPSSTSNAAETSQVGTGAGAEAWCLERKAPYSPRANLYIGKVISKAGADSVCCTDCKRRSWLMS